MSKVKDWEYDDIMHDYLQWQNELERLLDAEEPDEEAIKEAEDIIADYEDALYGDYDDKEETDYEEEEEEYED